MRRHDPLVLGAAYVLRDRAEPGVYVGHRKCVSVPWLKPVEDTYPWGSRWPMFRFPDGREIPSDPHHILGPVSEIPVPDSPRPATIRLADQPRAIRDGNYGVSTKGEDMSPDRPLLRVSPEPRIGTIRVGANGTRWRKTRRLGAGWEAAVLDGIAWARTSPTGVPAYVIEAMGYTQEPAP